MPKLHECTPGQYCFWCPGCECAHHIYTEGKVSWTLTGGLDSPTVRPSLLHNKGEKGAQCHYHVTEGKLEYFFDTFHQYRSQTVEIPEWDERIHNRYSIRPQHEKAQQSVLRNRSPKGNMVCSFNFEKD
jgi:hypothetical protein